ncbi:hypothetical protein CC1G_13724 [Coprinopsis cinerea okayama7|uniref:Uncharacterized protein n=1 Tax=Coprinopsis cinerea (strain Okayama-7 / 130 / ATCC MYA-4618 / FGSC 9003) TaxID=240176 RepID=D6RK65_COPC7|nr:hypothetical protein CC1G_13724 [Coprinopsis cinerea okayama7\|eukprot:XP_002912192.1 hypothetical protein CC1G_13724 [Coprinopsis cinerea okayama7\
MSSPQEHTPDQKNVALSYLAAVEEQFNCAPEHYHRFLEYMTQYNRKEITASSLVTEVSAILYKFEHLVDGFNAFLPDGWTMKTSPDEKAPNAWVVNINTPEGEFIRRYSEVVLGEEEEEQEESSTKEEFKQMIQLVNDIQTRYTDDPAIYREFLKAIDPNSNSGSREEIFAVVKNLLHESPDLVGRFQTLVVGGD